MNDDLIVKFVVDEVNQALAARTSLSPEAARLHLSFFRNSHDDVRGDIISPPMPPMDKFPSQEETREFEPFSPMDEARTCVPHGVSDCEVCSLTEEEQSFLPRCDAPEEVIESATQAVIAVNRLPGPKLTRFMARQRAKAAVAAAQEFWEKEEDNPLEQKLDEAHQRIGEMELEIRLLEEKTFHKGMFADFAEAFCSGWNRHQELGNLAGEEFMKVIMDVFENSGAQRAQKVVKTMREDAIVEEIKSRDFRTGS